MWPLQSMTAPLTKSQRIAPPVPKIVYFLDNFTDVDGTSLFSHTPDIGGLWSVASGAGSLAQQSINANQLRTLSVNTSTTFYYNSIGQSNYVLTGTYKFDPGGGANIVGALMFRYVDSSNYWRLDVSGNLLRLREITANVNTVRASAVLATTAGVTYSYTVTLNGTSIAATVNSVSVAFASASHQSATLAGIFFQQPNTPRIFQYFDTFEAREL